jgi:hypothetical protein
MSAYCIFDREGIRNAERLEARVAWLFPAIVEAVLGEPGVTYQLVQDQTLAEQGAEITAMKLLQRADRTDRYCEFNEYWKQTEAAYTAVVAEADPIAALVADIETHQEDWTPAEWEQVDAGELPVNAVNWPVETRDGEWQVWRHLCGDDAHERLYRSPAGQYYLGSVRDTRWRDGESFVAPYEDETSWIANPLRAVPPVDLYYAEPMLVPDLHSYDDAFKFAAEQPLTFMRVVAAAWLLGWRHSGHEWLPFCPDELLPIVREFEIARPAEPENGAV